MKREDLHGFEISTFDLFINSIKDAVFKCPMCGKFVFSTVKTDSDGNVGITRESCDIRGGLDNKKLKENICTDCQKAMTLQQSTELVYRFGDILNYISPVNKQLKTRCLFIRKEGYKAVVMFENAEFAARVRYDSLEMVK